MATLLPPLNPTKLDSSAVGDLRSLRTLGQIPASTFDQLKSKMKFWKCLPGTVILREGDLVTSWYVVLKGSVSIHQKKQFSRLGNKGNNPAGSQASSPVTPKGVVPRHLSGSIDRKDSLYEGETSGHPEEEDEDSDAAYEASRVPNIVAAMQKFQDDARSPSFKDSPAVSRLGSARDGEGSCPGTPGSPVRRSRDESLLSQTHGGVGRAGDKKMLHAPSLSKSLNHLVRKGSHADEGVPFSGTNLFDTEQARELFAKKPMRELSASLGTKENSATTQLVQQDKVEAEKPTEVPPAYVANYLPVLSAQLLGDRVHSFSADNDLCHDLLTHSHDSQEMKHTPYSLVVTEECQMATLSTDEYFRLVHSLDPFLHAPQAFSEIMLKAPNERSPFECGVVVSGLSCLKFFLGWTPSELKEVAPLLKLEKLPESWRVCKQGSAGQKLYILLSGSLGVYQRGDQEEEGAKPTAQEGETDETAGSQEGTPLKASGNSVAAPKSLAGEDAAFVAQDTLQRDCGAAVRHLSVGEGWDHREISQMIRSYSLVTEQECQLLTMPKHLYLQHPHLFQVGLPSVLRSASARKQLEGILTTWPDDRSNAHVELVKSLLNPLTFFQPYDEATVRALSRHAGFLRVPAGAYLARRRDVVASFCWILSGQVRMVSPAVENEQIATQSETDDGIPVCRLYSNLSQATPHHSRRPSLISSRETLAETSASSGSGFGNRKGSEAVGAGQGSGGGGGGQARPPREMILEPGQTFGNKLVSGTTLRYDCDLQAAQECTFLVLEKDKYLELINDEDNRLLREVMAFMQSVPVLKQMTEEQMVEFCQELTPMSLTSGTKVFTEGQPADDVYIISEGMMALKMSTQASLDAQPGSPNSRHSPSTSQISPFHFHQQQQQHQLHRNLSPQNHRKEMTAESFGMDLKVPTPIATPPTDPTGLISASMLPTPLPTPSTAQSRYPPPPLGDTTTTSSPSADLLTPAQLAAALCPPFSPPPQTPNPQLTLKTLDKGPHASSVEVGVLGPAQLAGEVALLLHTQQPFTVTCAVDVQALRLSAMEFMSKIPPELIEQLREAAIIMRQKQMDRGSHLMGKLHSKGEQGSPKAKSPSNRASPEHHHHHHHHSSETNRFASWGFTKGGLPGSAKSTPLHLIPPASKPVTNHLVTGGNMRSEPLPQGGGGGQGGRGDATIGGGSPPGQHPHHSSPGTTQSLSSFSPYSPGMSASFASEMHYFPVGGERQTTAASLIGRQSTFLTQGGMRSGASPRLHTSPRQGSPRTMSPRSQYQQQNYFIMEEEEEETMMPGYGVGGRQLRPLLCPPPRAPPSTAPAPTRHTAKLLQHRNYTLGRSNKYGREHMKSGQDSNLVTKALLQSSPALISTATSQLGRADVGSFLRAPKRVDDGVGEKPKLAMSEGIFRDFEELKWKNEIAKQRQRDLKDEARTLFDNRNVVLERMQAMKELEALERHKAVEARRARVEAKKAKTEVRINHLQKGGAHPERFLPPPYKKPPSDAWKRLTKCLNENQDLEWKREKDLVNMMRAPTKKQRDKKMKDKF